MRCPAVLCLAAALLLGDCTTTVAGQASPATAAPPEVAALVEDLFAGVRPASAGGLESLAEYVVAHNHPLYDYSVAECVDQVGGHGSFDDSMALNKIPTGELWAADGWVPSEGRYAGESPDGDLYALPVTDVVQWAGSVHTTTYLAHVAVLDGEAFFFQRCER